MLSFLPEGISCVLLKDEKCWHLSIVAFSRGSGLCFRAKKNLSVLFWVNVFIDWGAERDREKSDVGGLAVFQHRTAPMKSGLWEESRQQQRSEHDPINPTPGCDPARQLYGQQSNHSVVEPAADSTCSVLAHATEEGSLYSRLLTPWLLLKKCCKKNPTCLLAVSTPLYKLIYTCVFLSSIKGPILYPLLVFICHRWLHI